MPVLRIAARVVVGIYLDVLHASLGSMGSGPPGTLYRFHMRKLVQRKAAPDPLAVLWKWSALGFATVLITEHTPVARLVITHYMRAQKPGRAVIPADVEPPQQPHGDKFPQETVRLAETGAALPLRIPYDI